MEARYHLCFYILKMHSTAYTVLLKNAQRKCVRNFWLVPIFESVNLNGYQSSINAVLKIYFSAFTIPIECMDCIYSFSVHVHHGRKCNVQRVHMVKKWMRGTTEKYCIDEIQLPEKYQFRKEQTISCCFFFWMLKFMNTIICYKNPISECSIYLNKYATWYSTCCIHYVQRFLSD